MTAIANFLFGTTIGRSVLGAIGIALALGWFTRTIEDRVETRIRQEIAEEEAIRLREVADDAARVDDETTQQETRDRLFADELEQFQKELQDEREESPANAGAMCLDPAAADRLLRLREKAGN
ncbi:MAG: hypothetical protein ABS76_26555 [Pelagibacterium sp. SCN 64-44]|nr:MAG: hypothetical protein ABS76_26555 [Pelagibacterium sp. SCN 64-44]